MAKYMGKKWNVRRARENIFRMKKINILWIVTSHCNARYETNGRSIKSFPKPWAKVSKHMNVTLVTDSLLRFLRVASQEKLHTSVHINDQEWNESRRQDCAFDIGIFFHPTLERPRFLGFHNIRKSISLRSLAYLYCFVHWSQQASKHRSLAWAWL